MIVTVGLKREGLHKARISGVLPDFKRVFDNIRGVRLVEVFGRGRYADFEMTDDAYRRLVETYRSEFSFAKERELEPYSKERLKSSFGKLQL